MLLSFAYRYVAGHDAVSLQTRPKKLTTPNKKDQAHAECIVVLAALGYHILCEKPMAITPQDCATIVRAVIDANVMFAVGHVLRYSPYNRTIKRLIQEGTIGDVVNIVHVEPVGWWHFAHSYVRGNWSREEMATFSLMAKSCQ